MMPRRPAALIAATVVVTGFTLVVGLWTVLASGAPGDTSGTTGAAHPRSAASGSSQGGGDAPARLEAIVVAVRSISAKPPAAVAPVTHDLPAATGEPSAPTASPAPPAAVDRPADAPSSAKQPTRSNLVKRHVVSQPPPRPKATPDRASPADKPADPDRPAAADKPAVPVEPSPDKPAADKPDKPATADKPAASEADKRHLENNPYLYK